MYNLLTSLLITDIFVGYDGYDYLCCECLAQRLTPSPFESVYFLCGFSAKHNTLEFTSFLIIK
jgi:hypothetical protein